MRYDQIAKDILVEQYEYLLENVKSGVVFFDHEHNIIYHNTVFAKILGDLNKSYLGFNLCEVLNLKPIVCLKVSQGSCFEFQKTLSLDNNTLVINYSFSPVKRKDLQFMGFMTMNVITSMEKQVDDLLVRELDMKKIIEKSLIGIIVIDKEHKLIDANTAFCNLIGYIQDELIGKYSWEYLDGYTEARVKAEFPKLDEVTNVTKAGFITKNGDIITVKVMGKGGRVQGEPVIVYFVDTFPKD